MTSRRPPLRTFATFAFAALAFAVALALAFLVVLPEGNLLSAFAFLVVIPEGNLLFAFALAVLVVIPRMGNLLFAHPGTQLQP